MRSTRISPVPVLLSALAAFVACSFGADDFSIVQGNESGGDGTGDVANAAGNDTSGGASGGSPSGGSSSTGGSAAASAGESGAGAAQDNGGAAGAGPTLPTFLCAPQAEPFTILSQAEHQMRTIDQVEVVASADGAVVVAVGPSMPRQGASRLVYRLVRDSNGGTPDAVGSSDVMGSRLSLAASLLTIRRELRIAGLDQAGAFEYSVAVPNGGQFASGTRTDLDAQQYCAQPNGGLRDLKADYSTAGLGYAFTCNLGQDGQPGTTYQLYLREPGAIAPTLLPGATDVNAIVRRYLRLGSQNLLLVGNEVGSTVGLRFGADEASLRAVHSLGLSSDPNVYSTFQLSLFPSGLFVTGAAFTTDGDNPPPLVPASIYAGEVDPSGLDSLSSATPPRALNRALSYTKASQLVGVEDVMGVGVNRLGVGVHVATKDRISATFFTQKGELLAGPTEIYKTAGGQITDHSANVVPLGLGALLVWAESSEVKGRMFACLQD